MVCKYLVATLADRRPTQSLAGGWNPERAYPLEPTFSRNFALSSSYHPCDFLTIRMSPLGLLCSHSKANAEACAVSILARSWYTADEPLYHADFSERAWLSRILFDHNKVYAALLHTEYCHRRVQFADDGAALAALQQQYYKLQCSVTPIFRLPVEIFQEIFYIALDSGEPRRGLMHVCQDWRRTIEGMSNIWVSLKLRAWTAPESVQQTLVMAGGRPLIVEIDIERPERELKGYYSALGIAATSASQWRALTITSWHQSEQEVQELENIFSKHLPPMNKLTHIRMMRSVTSPLPHQLLQNIATAAVGCLNFMEIHSPLDIQYLLQPSHVSIFNSLTTFKALSPRMNHPVDLLPHFNQLEVLELTNLLLPLYGSEPLPLVDTLHQLHLKGASIQWMGGRVFPQLKSCTIITPPVRSHPLALRVTLPVCTTFEIVHQDVSFVRNIHVPNVCSLMVKCSQWSAVHGHEQIAHLFRVVIETPLKPHALHLAIQCQDKFLLPLLMLLPRLEELKLDLARPAALSKNFFIGLIAKPNGPVDWAQFNELKKGTGWRATICPCLRYLELRYEKWLRQSDSLEFLAPLLAMSWSRGRTVTPLELCLLFKSPQNSWKPFNLNPQSTVMLSSLGIPLFMELPDTCTSLSFDKLDQCFASTTHLPQERSTWGREPYKSPLFTLCSYHLQVLKIYGLNQTLPSHTLLAFQQLKELVLDNVSIPLLPHTVHLPLVHTLRNLSLFMSSLSWMDGRRFGLLERFEVDEIGWPISFQQRVGMPACTHIKFRQQDLEVLPLLQSNFQLPSLEMWEFAYSWRDSNNDKQGISALQMIQAKSFSFTLWGDCHGLFNLLEFKDEIERLVLQFWTSFPVQKLLTRFSEVNEHTGKVACPNMKVLDFHFQEVSDKNKDVINQWCIQMMDRRRLIGHPLEECRFWWDSDLSGPLSLL